MQAEKVDVYKSTDLYIGMYRELGCRGTPANFINIIINIIINKINKIIKIKKLKKDLLILL